MRAAEHDYGTLLRAVVEGRPAGAVVLDEGLVATWIREAPVTADEADTLSDRRGTVGLLVQIAIEARKRLP